MFALLLAVSLAASPRPSLVDAWADKTCPLGKGGDSNVEQKQLQFERSECLAKAMNRELDRFLVPRRKKDPAAFKTWMALQADSNRFVKDWCQAAEDLQWIDLQHRARTSGSGVGTTHLSCLQSSSAQRGFFARALASGELAPFWSSVDAVQPAGKKSLAAIADTLKRVRTAGTSGNAEGMVPLSPKEWADLTAQLTALARRPGELAKGHCAALSKAPADCAAKLEAWFASFAEVHPG